MKFTPSTTLIAEIFPTNGRGVTKRDTHMDETLSVAVIEAPTTYGSDSGSEMSTQPMVWVAPEQACDWTEQVRRHMEAGISIP